MLDINNKIKESYDSIPYNSKAFMYATASRLESVATLLNLETIDSRKARILELGCSFGGNIISQAMYNEDSYYVGVDLSEVQINEGKKIIEKMQLKNIELYSMDFLNFDYEKFGKFDYVICHGVYSWVPDIVKDKILEIISNVLSDNGLAYVSFNAYPGWKTQSLIRDIMLYSNKYYDSLDNNEKINRSKIILSMINDQKKLFEDNKNFEENVNNVLNKDNYYLIHEYLEEYNDPMYLHEFDDRLVEKNLKHLSSVTLSDSFITNYNKEVQKNIIQLSKDNHIVKEQCIDYMKNTLFKRSIICRIENIDNANFSENINKEVLNKFYLYGNLEILGSYDENFKNLLQINKKVYKISDLLDNLAKSELYINSDLKEKEHLENMVYTVVLFNIVNSRIAFTKYNFYKEFNFKTNKITNKFEKYLTYFLEEENPKISIANSINEVEILTNLDIYTILQLSKENDFEIIKNNVIKYMNDNNFVFLNEENKEVDNNKVISDYLNKILDKLCIFSEIEDK